MQRYEKKVGGERRVDPEGMYLDFLNNYSRVERFAHDCGISQEYALEQIKKGKSINQSR